MNLRHLLSLVVARHTDDVTEIEKIQKEFHALSEVEVFELMGDARSYRSLEPAASTEPASQYLDLGRADAAVQEPETASQPYRRLRRTTNEDT